jgi:hypothetical protein
MSGGNYKKIYCKECIMKEINTSLNKRYHFIRKYYGLIFFTLLSIVLWVMLMINVDFANWYFSRHANVLSWAIRPLFMVGFCYFALKRNATLAAAMIFLTLLSSVFFPAPEAANPMVEQFLAKEKEWILGPLSVMKITEFGALVGGIFLLGYAFWKRSLKWGITLLLLVVFLKILWGVIYGGESGITIVYAALFTGVVTMIWIILYRRRSLKKDDL